jgi:hypothetical protein
MSIIKPDRFVCSIEELLEKERFSPQPGFSDCEPECFGEHMLRQAQTEVEKILKRLPFVLSLSTLLRSF